jgi:hypothetical protein
LTDATLQYAQPAQGRALAAFLGGLAVWTGAFLSGFVISDPAPYELYMAGLIGIWVLTGLVIPRSTVFLLIMIAVFNLGGVISMFQMAHWADAPLYIAVSLFLGLTSVFFSAVTAARYQYLRMIFNGWTAAAVLTALAGIAGYLELVPGADLFTRYGRAKGAFEDPNVFAPYLVLPAVWCLYKALTGSPARSLVPLAILGILTLGLFLSFSRGGWGLFLASTILLMSTLFLSSNSGRFRLRLILMSLFTLFAIAVVLVVALQFDSIRDIFFERARIVQDYDAGRYGRFGRQIAGLLAAMEQPFGIGPLQFGKVYGEDTHNIWLKALFDYSWLGFAAYFVLIVVTLAGGLRILFRDRPWQPYLQCAYIVLIGHIAIGMIIDTDHWRHFYVLLGIVWGCIALEARYSRANADHLDAPNP